MRAKSILCVILLLAIIFPASAADLPVKMVLTIDVSGSMGGEKIEKAKNGAVTFLDVLVQYDSGKDDEVALVTFSNDVHVLSDLTNDFDRLRSLISTLSATGSTSMWDAVYYSVDLLKNDPSEAKAVLLLTDGQDNDSEHTKKDAIQHAKNNKVRIFVVGVGADVNDDDLRELAEETGGSYWHINVANLVYIYEMIALKMSLIFPPDAEITYSPQHPKVGEVVTFDASQSSSPKGIVTYNWLFSDGTTAQGVVVNHVFTKPGNHTVALTVYDSDYIPDTEIITVNVTPAANSPPSITLQSPSNGYTFDSSTTSVTLKWTATDPEGDTLTYDLYFGTSSSPPLYKSDLPSPSYTVSVSPGKTYYWKVVAKDSAGNEAASAIWSFSIKSTTPTPTKPVIQLSYKNVVNLGESTNIKVKIYGDSIPIKANVKLKIDGKTVENVNTHEFTYTFTPSKIGEYVFEVLAEYKGIESQEIGKITVIGDVSDFIQLAHYMKTLAYGEIDQATYLSSSKAVDFASSVGASFAAEKIMEVLGPVVHFSGGLVSEAYRDNLKDFADILGYQYEEVLSEALSEDVEDIIEAGFSSVKDYATNLFVKKVIEPIAHVVSNKAQIHSNTILLENYIRQKPEKFLNDPYSVRKLFLIYMEPIKYTVEKEPLGTVSVPIIGEITIWSFQDQVKFYDTVKFLKTVITIVSIVTAVIIVVATLIIAAKATAVSFGTLLPLIAAKVGGILKIAWTISQSSKAILALAVAMLIITTPTVVKIVNEKHENSVNLLIEAMEGMTPRTTSIKATNVKVLQSAYISSAGHIIVVTPDGKVVKVMKGSGYYTPKSVGNYRVLSYTHTHKRLFYTIKSTTFNVTEPNVTMNTSYSISGLNATVFVDICNFEDEPIENLILILTAKNSSDYHVFTDSRNFNIDKNSCRHLSFALSFNESDLYTVTSTLSIMAIYELKKDKFFLNIGNVSKDDLIIKTVDVKKVYSPTKKVTFNITILTQTAMEFEIFIPLFNYSTNVFANGAISIPIELPKLSPGEYSFVIQAIRDEKVLDYETVKFTVEAIDVAILAFTTKKIYYLPNEEVILNLMLKNLENRPVDANVVVQVIKPSGEVQNYTAIKIGSEYQVKFTPIINGTFIVRGKAFKEGYTIKNDEMRIIVGNISKLEMVVNETDDLIFVKVFANGLLTTCNLTLIKGDQISTYSISGLAILNKTLLSITGYKLIADKEFYEPAVYAHLLEPVASLTFSLPSPTVGQILNFDASSSYDPDGQIISYQWNFGDGSVETTTSPTIQHTYSSAGTYTVTLTVTDNDGLTASTSKQITIKEISQKQQIKQEILSLILQYLQTQDAQQKQQIKQLILQKILQYLLMG